MYKLLIVDDEYYIRDGIRRAIDWASIEVEVVGEAANGRAALDMMEVCDPDIIISDICMEDMDGLIFAAFLRKKYPDKRVIFLSGHERFDFAKKAVELKVVRYILKPGHPDTILAAVSEAIAEIERDRLLSTRLSYLEQNWSNEQQYLYEKVFDDILQNRVNEAEMQLTAEQLAMPISGFFAVVLLRMDGFYDRNLREDAAKLYNRLQGARTIALAVLTKRFFAYAIIRRSAELLVVVGHPNQDFPALISDLEGVGAMVKAELGSSCTMGVGGFTAGWRGIYTSFIEAQTAMDYKITMGNDCIITKADIPTFERYAYPKQREEQILRGILSYDKRATRQAIAAFVREMKEKEYDRTQVRAVLGELFVVIDRFFKDADIDLHSIYDRIWIDPYYATERYCSLEEIKNWLINILSDAVSVLQSRQEQNTKRIIMKMQEFINEQYANPDVSLHLLAEEFHLHPTYLSKLYKKETGETYVELLTRIRMNEAKRLLKSTNRKVGDIGTAVGYANTQYFCTLFKKLFKCSPLEYREGKRL